MVLFFAVMLALSPVLNAQEKKDQAKEPTNYWELDAGLATQAALQMIGAGNVLGTLGARVLAADDRAAIPSWRFVFEEPLPIYPKYLDAIRDKRPLPDIRTAVGKTLRKLPEWESPGSPDWGWYHAFNYALRRADEADMQMFKKGAQECKDVVYPHLKATPQRYRGKIITVTGKLTVIRREDAPRFVPDHIERIYTGYITGPTQGAPPFAIAFTELPDKVQPSEKLNLDVTFYGYFLSLVSFPPDKGSKTQKEVVSPYLVGKTIIVNPRHVEATEGPYSYYIIAGVVGGFLTVAILVAAVNIWFRRGDRKIQLQLAAMREKNQPFNIEPAEPESAAQNPAATASPDPQTGVKPVQAPSDVIPPGST